MLEPTPPDRQPVSPPRRRRRPGAARLAVVGAAVAAIAVTACERGGTAGDEAAFCEDAIANADAIVRPVIDTPDDVEAVLQIHRDLGDEAPLDIEEHWTALVVNLETAATVNPSDEASVQRALARAYATEESAYEVRTWLLEHCDLDLGPITTVVPHAGAMPPGMSLPEQMSPTAPPPASAPAPAPSAAPPGPATVSSLAAAPPPATATAAPTITGD